MTPADELMPLEDWIGEQHVLLTAFEAFVTARHGAMPTHNTPQEWSDDFRAFAEGFGNPLPAHAAGDGDCARDHRPDGMNLPDPRRPAEPMAESWGDVAGRLEGIGDRLYRMATTAQNREDHGDPLSVVSQHHEVEWRRLVLARVEALEAELARYALTL